MVELTRRAALALPVLLVPRPARAQGSPEPLQDLLAQEHAAVYLYGVAAPRLPKSLRDRAAAVLDDHRRHRDTLVRLVRAAGAEPVAALPAYDVPEGSALDVVAQVEQSLVLRWRAAVTDVVPGDRPLVTAAYADEAVHLTTWRWAGNRDAGRSVAAFPGRG